MQAARLTSARILVAHAAPESAGLLAGALARAGYDRLAEAADASRLLDACGSFHPDLVLLDVHLPGLAPDSARWRGARRGGGCGGPLLLALTAGAGAENIRLARALGARDVLALPCELDELQLRVECLLETRFLRLQLQNRSRVLEEARESAGEREEAQIELLERVTRVAECHDDSTGEHPERVGRLAGLLGRDLGLPGGRVAVLRRAAVLHDVGKIGVPGEILTRPGKLTLPEFERVKVHTVLGSQLLSGSRFPILQEAAEIALSHHERWDGTGYPRGLGGDAIPLSGRIVAVADVWDALTHVRPYKLAWREADARAEIARQGGRQFDPRVVEAFLRVSAPG